MRANAPEAVLPVPAATVVLVREQASRLQVLLLRRSAESRFMGGTYVFPGGRVEPADEDAGWWQPHVDLEPDLIFRRLGGDGTLGEALAAAVAAVRESFEEAGVLFARLLRRAVAGSPRQTACRRIFDRLVSGACGKNRAGH